MLIQGLATAIFQIYKGNRKHRGSSMSLQESPLVRTMLHFIIDTRRQWLTCVICKICQGSFKHAMCIRAPLTVVAVFQGPWQMTKATNNIKFCCYYFFHMCKPMTKFTIHMRLPIMNSEQNICPLKPLINQVGFLEHTHNNTATGGY